MGYKVTAPLVVAHTADGSQHIYEGGFLPESTDATQLAQLIEAEQVIEFDASDGDSEAKPATTRGKAKANDS